MGFKSKVDSLEFVNANGPKDYDGHGPVNGKKDERGTEWALTTPLNKESPIKLTHIFSASQMNHHI